MGMNAAQGRLRAKERAMQYMLLIYRSEAALKNLEPRELGEMMAAFGAYTKALHDSGAFVAGDRLRPVGDATTVRTVDGRNKVLNGPYAETKEQLGGYYIIDVADLDAALTWAARCPGSQYGAIEVRPVWTM
jgi:hypothetical protein